MATKDEARQQAEQRARMEQVDYCIIQSRNHQWTVEKLSFCRCAQGRMIYKDRTINTVTPLGVWYDRMR